MYSRLHGSVVEQCGNGLYASLFRLMFDDRVDEVSTGIFHVTSCVDFVINVRKNSIDLVLVFRLLLLPP